MRAYRIKQPQVISETIDGETIIINLESGHYFSLNKTGGEIWESIREGKAMENTGHPSVQQFLDHLEREGLVASENSESDAAQTFPEDPNTASAILTFEKPLLQKYEDMQDLLLLDPIHDVDETGWPMSK